MKRIYISIILLIIFTFSGFYLASLDLDSLLTDVSAQNYQCDDGAGNPNFGDRSSEADRFCHCWNNSEYSDSVKSNLAQTNYDEWVQIEGQCNNSQSIIEQSPTPDNSNQDIQQEPVTSNNIGSTETEQCGDANSPNYGDGPNASDPNAMNTHFCKCWRTEKYRGYNEGLDTGVRTSWNRICGGDIGETNQSIPTTAVVNANFNNQSPETEVLNLPVYDNSAVNAGINLGQGASGDLSDAELARLTQISVHEVNNLRSAVGAGPINPAEFPIYFTNCTGPLNTDPNNHARIAEVDICKYLRACPTGGIGTFGHNLRTSDCFRDVVANADSVNPNVIILFRPVANSPKLANAFHFEELIHNLQYAGFGFGDGPENINRVYAEWAMNVARCRASQGSYPRTNFSFYRYNFNPEITSQQVSSGFCGHISTFLNTRVPESGIPCNSDELLRMSLGIRDEGSLNCLRIVKNYVRGFCGNGFCINADGTLPGTVNSVYAQVESEPLESTDEPEDTEEDSSELDTEDTAEIISESGKYSYFDGIQNREIFIEVAENESVKIAYFEDLNGDGVLNEDQEEVLEPESNEVTEIDLEKTEDIITYDLSAGWNSIAVPMINENYDTAEEFIEVLRTTEVSPIHIARFRAGKFEMYTARTTGDSFGDGDAEGFPIEPGKGYFIFVVKAGTLNLSGQRLKDPLPLIFSNGWNLVSFVTPAAEYDSEDLIENLRRSQVEANTISSFKNGIYSSVIKDKNILYGNNFNIVDENGYFIKVNEGGGGTFNP